MAVVETNGGELDARRTRGLERSRRLRRAHVPHRERRGARGEQ
jgi:hypothetical protein